tara:strand:- start:55 stop:435 length:381 start_codon:yes stop_codon:yes gene_type:complete
MDIQTLIDRCPYAKGAKTKTIENASKVDMLREVYSWDDSFDVIVFLPKWSWFNYYSWCMRSMRWMSKIDMTVVPDSKNGFILLQRLSHLVEASDELMNTTDYYAKASKSDMRAVMYRKKLARDKYE